MRAVFLSLIGLASAAPQVSVAPSPIQSVAPTHLAARQDTDYGFWNVEAKYVDNRPDWTEYDVKASYFHPELQATTTCFDKYFPDEVQPQSHESWCNDDRGNNLTTAKFSYHLGGPHASDPPQTTFILTQLVSLNGQQVNLTGRVWLVDHCTSGPAGTGTCTYSDTVIAHLAAKDNTRRMSHK